MNEYEKPVAEIINLQPVEKLMTNGWNDEASNWGSNDEWDEGWE